MAPYHWDIEFWTPDAQLGHEHAVLRGLLQMLTDFWPLNMCFWMAILVYAAPGLIPTGTSEAPEKEEASRQAPCGRA